MEKIIDVQTLKQAISPTITSEAFRRPRKLNKLAVGLFFYDIWRNIHKESDTKVETELKNQIISDTLAVVGYLRGSYEGLEMAYDILLNTPKPRKNQKKCKRKTVPNKRGRPRNLTADFAADYVQDIDEVKAKHGIKTDKDAIRFIFKGWSKSQWRVEVIVNQWAVKLSKARKMLKSQHIDL